MIRTKSGLHSFFSNSMQNYKKDEITSNGIKILKFIKMLTFRSIMRIFDLHEERFSINLKKK